MAEKNSVSSTKNICRLFWELTTVKLGSDEK